MTNALVKNGLEFFDFMNKLRIIVSDAKEEIKNIFTRVKLKEKRLQYTTLVMEKQKLVISV